MGAAYIGPGFESRQSPAWHGGARGLPKVSLARPGVTPLSLRLSWHSDAKGIVGN